MADPTLTVIGNITADPELKFTSSGAAVTNFTVAHTPRTFDRQANKWRDGEPLFLRCSVWREQAENVAESLHRGDRVVVTGKLVSRSWETDTGEKRTVMELAVEEVGVSLRFATATPVKAGRAGGAPVAAPATAAPVGSIPSPARPAAPTVQTSVSAFDEAPF